MPAKHEPEQEVREDKRDVPIDRAWYSVRIGEYQAGYFIGIHARPQIATAVALRYDFCGGAAPPEKHALHQGRDGGDPATQDFNRPGDKEDELYEVLRADAADRQGYRAEPTRDPHQ